MSHLGPAKKPFEVVSIDTIGGFGGSRSTKKYLHLLVDHFTRFAYILTSKTQNASDFIKLTENVLKDHNIEILLTDQYPGINSKDFKNFLEKKNVTIIFTAINAPFSNGLNERLNQTLVNKVRCAINEEKNKCAWTTIAHKCVDKYNETEHTVTGFSPKYLLLGEDTSVLPEELKKKKNSKHLENDRTIAFQNSKKNHDYNKKLYDKNRLDYKFNVGELVYIENGNRLNRKKLDLLRIGPYKILKKISDSIYEIDITHRRSESKLFHISKLIPFPKTSEEEIT
ncbi:Gypsy retrotransposon integrase-like protein 1 [Camponotus japonicus]